VTGPATAISQATLFRLQNHLRQALGCSTIFIHKPKHPGASVELRVGSEVLGTVDQVDEDGERSWVVTLIVLEEDLAAAD
jgi:Protein of unknown function (DUF3126)